MAKYLDYAGLGLYDKLIKELIKNNQLEVVNRINDVLGGSDVDINLADLADALGVPASDGGVATGVYALIDALDAKHDEDIDGVRDLIAEITGADSEGLATIGELKAAIDANTAALAALNGDGDDSIDSRINSAVASIIDNAPETLDTLKEIADWIEGADSDADKLAIDVVKNAADIAQNTSDIATNATAIEDIKSDVADAVEDAANAYADASSRIDALEDALGITGSDSDDSVIDRLDAIETRLDSIREEEDEFIPDADVRGLFDADINAKVDDPVRD